MTTLRDIANQLDLSVGLVSRVLNEKADVRTSQATRARIVETAQALNYHPSAQGRALVTGRTMQIAAIYQTGDRYETSGESGYLSGLADVAAKNDYRVLILPLDDEASERKLESLLRERAVDGVCLFSNQVDAPHLRALETHPIPTVVIGDPGELDWGANHISAARVDFDNYRYSYDSVMWLAEQGHRRIAYVRSAGEIEHGAQPNRAHQQHTRALQSGYRDAMKELNAKPLLLASPNSHDEIAAFVRSGGATAAVVRYLHGALAWTMALGMAGLRLPRDFTVLAQLERAELPPLRLSACSKFIAVHERDQRALGALAGDVLVNWVRGEKPVGAETLVAPAPPAWGNPKHAAQTLTEKSTVEFDRTREELL